MAPVSMHIDKFDRVVIIDDDHPLAVAQLAKNAAVPADTRRARSGPAASKTPASKPATPPVEPPVHTLPELFLLPPGEREVPAVQAYLEGLPYAELQRLAKEHEGISANQSAADLIVLLTVALTTPAE